MEPEELHRLSDASLVDHFFETGRMVFFEEIWSRYVRLIYACCLRILGNPSDAEDATADTFVKALEALRVGNFTNNNLRGWLTTIARFVSLNWLKRAATRRGTEDVDIDQIAGLSVEPEESAAEIQRVLNMLSDKQRIALKLFYIEGMTYEEIAGLQGWQIEAVKSYVQNGRRMFAKYWIEGESKTGS